MDNLSKETLPVKENVLKASELSEHSIECDKNYLLTGLFLSRQDINGQKHQKYVYECSKNKITGNEIKINTDLADYGKGTLQNLEKHNIECPDKN